MLHKVLNIVHFGKYYPPDIGGIESVTSSLSRGGVRRGFRVTVVCFARQRHTSVELADGVKVVRCPVLFSFLSQPFGVAYLVQCVRFGLRADVIQVHMPNLVAALAAILSFKSSKVVTHWHSDIVDKGIAEKIVRPLVRSLLAFSRTIIVTSAEYLQASADLASQAHKVRVIPIGIQDVSKRFTNTVQTAESRELERLIEGKKVVLSIGRLVEYKGFDILIRAANKLEKNTIVIIVGSGPLERDLKSLICDMSVGHLVYMLGKLSRENLYWLLRKSDLFCLPSNSRAEAFGVVLLEAMSMALPVVATKIQGSGVPWVNKHNVSGLNVSVNDEMQIADACNQILSSDELGARFSLGARARFEQEFTEELFVDRFLQIYLNSRVI